MSEHRRKPQQPQEADVPRPDAASPVRPPAAARHREAPPGLRPIPMGRNPATRGRGPYVRQPRRGAPRGTEKWGPQGRRRGSRQGRGRAAPPDRKRIIDYPRYGKDGWRRWTPSWKLVSGLCVGFLGSLVAVAGFGYAMVSVPSEENALARSENNVYYWEDGTQMVATGSGQNRQNVTIDRIPEAMQWAVISAENKSFYQDSGIDPMGIARALGNMATGGDTQGGSTITQQFVKNTYLTQEQTVSRKFKEMFISIKVGTKLTKKDILQGYLNTSYYGRGAYGIQAAAQTYYGKDAVKLTPSECAFLAALLKGPTYYDPAGNPSLDSTATPEKNRERSEERWGWILEQMHADEHLSDAKYQEAIKKYPEPQGRKAIKGMTGQVSYLVDTAKRYVLKNSPTSVRRSSTKAATRSTRPSRRARSTLWPRPSRRSRRSTSTPSGSGTSTSSSARRR
ncbi:hypothetical protein SHKM778_93710 [Streptomyces sp. KM77-8]|uniref:Glycosyl transferase family 51 domain-containing protein n=1 Tax=Streptomyces haneummycinicus TaxID=3074435 RepID=A0AAT9HZ36_9ACTN